jgi:nitroreductase
LASAANAAESFSDRAGGCGPNGRASRDAPQNVLLQAVTLNLGAVPIGAFEDNQVKQVLALPSDQQPLYLIPVGRP